MTPRTRTPTTAERLEAVTSEVGDLEAHIAQLRTGRAADRRELEDAEDQIARAIAAGEPTEALVEQSDELRRRVSRRDAALPIVEQQLSEKLPELDAARRAYLAEAVAESQDALVRGLTEFSGRWREALGPLVPLIESCRAHVEDLKRLHAERRRLDGRSPLTYAPELEEVYRRTGGAGHQLHVLGLLLEHGMVGLPDAAAPQAPPDGPTAEALRRMGADTDEVARRLGMRR